jgi:hypothetical protein
MSRRWLLLLALSAGAPACSVDDRVLSARSDGGGGGTTALAAPDLDAGSGGADGATSASPGRQAQ